MAFKLPTQQAAPARNFVRSSGKPAVAQEPDDHASSQCSDTQASQEWILFSPSVATASAYASASTARTHTLARSHIGSLDTAAARSYTVSEQAIDEDEELDSLDSHLHEFREDPSVYKEEEGHAGVFPTHDGLGAFRGMGEDVQRHLYAFERFNPRQIKRRRMSAEVEEIEERERVKRIEAWRMEQSRVLVEEIQRETRRRRQSLGSVKSTVEKEAEEVATLGTVGEEGFWDAVTRRVMGLMGIDADLLSVIFGESLPADAPPHGDKWEQSLLERIARELGILVTQISAHPGAFSTYVHTQSMPLPYAGLPVIPESSKDPEPQEVEFQPTIQSAEIPETTEDGITKEDWEKDLDIKMVYRYLRSRFTYASSDVLPSTTSSSTSTADTAARVARVRMHHPLVKAGKQKPRTFKVSMPEGRSRRGSEGRRSAGSLGSTKHYWDIGGSTVGSGSLIASTGAMGSWGAV